MSHYTKIADAIDVLSAMAKEIKIGPNGEGEDWLARLEAVLEDLEDVFEDLEPTEEEQGLIPIPAGYAEQ